MVSDKWRFVHTIVKGMIYNTLTCMNRLFRSDQVLVNSIDDMNTLKMKKLYAGVMRGWTKWSNKHHLDKSNEKMYLGMLKIAITLIKYDHVYEELFDDLISSINFANKIDVSKELKSLRILTESQDRAVAERRLDEASRLQPDIDKLNKQIRDMLIGGIKDEMIKVR